MPSFYDEGSIVGHGGEGSLRFPILDSCRLIFNLRIHFFLILGEYEVVFKKSSADRGDIYDLQAAISNKARLTSSIPHYQDDAETFLDRYLQEVQVEGEGSTRRFDKKRVLPVLQGRIKASYVKPFICD